MKQKVTFATRLGMIFATAGSAVGLGTIWHFPTTCGKSGGAAFILLYLAILIILGIPGMLSEFIVGRNGGENAFASYKKAGTKQLNNQTTKQPNNLWGLVGIMGALGGSLILGFYSVIAGWCLYYLYLAVVGQAVGSPEHIQATFNQLMAPENETPAILSVVFILITHFIITRGIQKGIEVASKIMIPALIFLLIMLIWASCSLDNAWQGIEFLFKPDFSKIDSHVVFMALGEGFFTLSLGTACLTTYASYFQNDTNITKSAVEIVAICMVVAIMAGLMIFPAAFSVNVEPDAGPSLVFLTMPNVFEKAFPHAIAYIVSIMFYLLLGIAALTSTISMHEIGTAVLSQETKLSRSKAAWCITLFCSCIGILCAMSMSHPNLGVFGMTFFDDFNMLTSNIMLPLGGLLTFVLIGWVMPRETVMEQLSSYGKLKVYKPLVNAYYILARFICPVLIACIFLFQIGVL